MNELIKATKEAIMIKTKLTLTALLLLISTVSLVADPISTNYTAGPEPVYGWDNLEENAEYPSLTRGMCCATSVVLNFKIDAVGKVSQIEVAKSGGAPYDQAAIEAVMSTKWNPAMQNGTARPVTMSLPFEFYSK